MPGLVEWLGDIFSVNCFEAPTHGQNVSNILSAILSKALRTFQYYKTRFDDLKYQQILRLPIRNFNAQEVADMQTACHDMMNRQNFGRELDTLLERFRAQRQKPKRASSYPTTYLVDNDENHFNLGHEIHARADTAIPPHNDLCVLANAFRFGRYFSGERHFNVSRERDEELPGNYLDCHGGRRGGDGAKHLNMFTNDFF